MTNSSTIIEHNMTDSSPCTGHCSTVLGDDVCRSCMRTFEEITQWVGLTAAQRRAINQRIANLKGRASTLKDNK